MFESNHSAAARFTSKAIALTSLLMTGACSKPADRQADSTRVASARSGDSAMFTDSAAARSASRPGASTDALKLSSEQGEVINALVSLGGKPIETLDAVDARKQPTPTDAVMAVLKKQGKPTTPEPVGSVTNRTIPGPGSALPIRVYTPVGNGVFPVIVYFHGGGFVIATNDTYDGSARALSNAAKAVLVSVEYRKAPEHKFPAAHDDAMAAYKWVVANAAALHVDPARIALAGESAGGNLAVSTAVAIKAAGGRAPVGILAVYPVAGSDTMTASYQQNAAAKPLSRPMMNWFFAKYTRTPADARDPRLNLMLADLSGLPPTTIVTAQVDPLRSDGELLADRLRAAGVSVNIRNYMGVAHEFFGQGAVVPTAKEAVEFAADGLKKTLSP